MSEKRLVSNSCHIMNDISHLTEDKIKDGLKTLEKKIKRYCYILHDKDTDTEGKPKHIHHHIFLEFNKNVDFKTVAKAFGIEIRFVEFLKVPKGRNRFEKSAAYLVHKNSPEKFQYDVAEVKANFNYIEMLENLENNKINNSDKRLEEIRDLIQSGKLKRHNLINYITMEEYAKYKTRIEAFFEYYALSVSREDISRKCIYIQGDKGTGKTYFAKEWCKSNGLSCYPSASSNDPLEGYGGEDVIILDDLRGSFFSYVDLLKLLDNNTNTLVKSRYHNKLLQCKYIIITSVKPIEGLYPNIALEDDEPLGQLKRRCSCYMVVNKENIKMYNYNKVTGDYDFYNSVPNRCPYLDKYEDDTVEPSLLDSFARVYVDKDEVILTEVESGTPYTIDELFPSEIDCFEIPDEILEVSFLYGMPEVVTTPKNDIEE